jgi:hypothetical protein
MQKQKSERKRIQNTKNLTVPLNFKIIFTVADDENYLNSELHFYLFGKRSNKDVIKLGIYACIYICIYICIYVYVFKSMYMYMIVYIYIYI